MFTIIMPVWNRAAIAPRAIESVLHQDFSDYELIIVDDGSTDDLETAVHPYLGDNVFLYYMPHQGVGAARNVGIYKADGDFIAYLDSDNAWHPSFLSNMWAAMHRGDEPKKAAYCRYNLYKKFPIIDKMYLREIGGEEFNFNKLLVKNYIDINSFVHAKECINMIGLWDETLKRLVDWDFILRLTARYEPVFLPEVLIDYYLNFYDNCISKTEDYDLAYTAIRVKNSAYKR
jgi:glycosyltransferase involved in cell wall biosynthesis